MTILDDGTILLDSTDVSPDSDDFWTAVALHTNGKFASVAKKHYELSKALSKIRAIERRGRIYSEATRDAINIASRALGDYGWVS